MMRQGAPYFPPLYGNVACEECDKASTCWCRSKYQRSFRDFTHSSGRCPRLPDRRGFVEPEERALYEETFPLIHAELGCESLHLSLTVPGRKGSRKIYRTKNGNWYVKERVDGHMRKRAVTISEGSSEEEIAAYMEHVGADYCLFRCVVEYWFV